MFSKSKIQELMSKFSQVNVNDIQDSSLRAKAAKLKKKQGGFTLLELLVVVAILAAIAGTATIALQDTDARAAAAAHVAMMDELNKGIRTYRVLQKNQFPDVYDSLLDDAGAIVDNAGDDAILAIEDIAVHTLTDKQAASLQELGINNLMYVDRGLAYDEDGNPTAVVADMVVNCATDDEVRNSIASKGNAMVAGNLFMNAEGNGCGEKAAVAGATAGGVGNTVAVWSGSASRVMGQGVSGSFGAEVDGTPLLLAVGLGPSSTLFEASTLGGMTSVPVYRHVSKDQYNRFIALFKIAEYDGTATAYKDLDHPQLAGIVDGAGDTKEEELGEWDGTRNTI